MDGRVLARTATAVAAAVAALATAVVVTSNDVGTPPQRSAVRRSLHDDLQERLVAVLLDPRLQ